MKDFILQNWRLIILAIIVLIILIFSIIHRKKLVSKIKKETISFVALIVSLALTIIGFAVKPQVEITTLAYIGGQRISLFFPIVGIFVVSTIVFLIIFFRKELKKEIKL